MMGFVLFHNRQAGIPEVIKRYTTRKGALIGMRASNRNAGWTRVSLSVSGIVEMEWAAKSNGLHDYAPYVIALDARFEEWVAQRRLVNLAVA